MSMFFSAYLLFHLYLQWIVIKNIDFNAKSHDLAIQLYQILKNFGDGSNSLDLHLHTGLYSYILTFFIGVISNWTWAKKKGHVWIENWIK